jgi:hypothetical protein
VKDRDTEDFQFIVPLGLQVQKAAAAGAMMMMTTTTTTTMVAMVTVW